MCYTTGSHLIKMIKISSLKAKWLDFLPSFLLSFQSLHVLFGRCSALLCVVFAINSVFCLCRLAFCTVTCKCSSAGVGIVMKYNVYMRALCQQCVKCCKLSRLQRSDLVFLYIAAAERLIMISTLLLSDAFALFKILKMIHVLHYVALFTKVHWPLLSLWT